jgi:hypothetical protein
MIIYYATSVNLLLELLNVFMGEEKTKHSLPEFKRFDKSKFVFLKYFQFANLTPSFKGEAYLREAGSLKMIPDFFNSDMALTDYIDDEHEWQAIFVHASEAEEELVRRMIHSRETLLEYCRKLL